MEKILLFFLLMLLCQGRGEFKDRKYSGSKERYPQGTDPNVVGCLLLVFALLQWLSTFHADNMTWELSK